ncbi:MAG: DNA repair protein RecO [Patescibacteria group bacterium]
MSHNIYKTEAIILGSKNSGESNRLLFLLTKELGFIIALSQGVRNLKSKLRYGLQDFNLINLELVRGKEVWRVTSAEIIKNYSKSLLGDERKAKSAGRIFLVLRRLMHGESKNRELFEDVSQFLSFIEKEDLNSEKLLLLEILVNLRILNHLGYGSNEESIKKFLSGNMSLELIDSLLAVRKKAVIEVNRALEESHL